MGKPHQGGAAPINRTHFNGPHFDGRLDDDRLHEDDGGSTRVATGTQGRKRRPCRDREGGKQERAERGKGCPVVWCLREDSEHRRLARIAELQRHSPELRLAVDDPGINVSHQGTARDRPLVSGTG